MTSAAINIENYSNISVPSLQRDEKFSNYCKLTVGSCYLKGALLGPCCNLLSPSCPRQTGYRQAPSRSTDHTKQTFNSNNLHAPLRNDYGVILYKHRGYLRVKEN